MSDMKYSKEHEWVRLEGDIATVGISEFAQEQLGDVVFVELPEVGSVLDKGAAFGVVESNKAVSDLYAPVAGEVVAVNEALADDPERVNESPYDEGWMIRVRIADASETEQLMSSDAYSAHVAAEQDA